MKKIQTLSFSINHWDHLYSLQQAIKHNSQLTGRKLCVNGRLLNQAFLQNTDTEVSIDFLQTDDIPVYPSIDSDTYLLGVMTFSQQRLSTQISVDKLVFEELRKNLMEYADIDGIHIIVSLGVLSNNSHWHDGESLDIVQLDYAMKGDA